MKLKQIYWDKNDPNFLSTTFMGLTLSVYKNNGKWVARLASPHHRPEIQQGFDTAYEAMRYAEHTLLVRELKKHFSFVNEWWYGNETQTQTETAD